MIEKIEADSNVVVIIEPTNTVRHAVVQGSSVTNVILWDGVEIPNDASATPFADAMLPSLLVLIPEGVIAGPGWSYTDGQFVPPPVVPQAPMTAEQAQNMKTTLIAEATARIAPLQDMHDLGEASPEEDAELLAWKRYRIALTRITSTSPGWPSSITWPVMPS